MKAKYRIRATPTDLYHYVLEQRTLLGRWKAVMRTDHKSTAEAYLSGVAKASLYSADGKPL